MFPIIAETASCALALEVVSDAPTGSVGAGSIGPSRELVGVGHAVSKALRRRTCDSMFDSLGEPSTRFATRLVPTIIRTAGSQLVCVAPMAMMFVLLSDPLSGLVDVFFSMVDQATARLSVAYIYIHLILKLVKS